MPVPGYTGAGIWNLQTSYMYVFMKKRLENSDTM